MSRHTENRWLAPLAAALSVLACYGTLAAIATLGALGVTLALNNMIWAGAVVIFAWLALPALWLSRRRHGLLLPLVLAIGGAAMITFVMLVSYVRLIEFTGFMLLCAGIWFDWHGKRCGKEIVE